MHCETQETINEWAEKTFGEIDARGAFLRCADEFAELAHALGLDAVATALAQSTRAQRDIALLSLSAVDESRSRIECADVLITLYRVMHVLDGQLHLWVDDKMAINRSRKWKMVGPGIGQHVKDD